MYTSPNTVKRPLTADDCRAAVKLATDYLSGIAGREITADELAAAIAASTDKE